MATLIFIFERDPVISSFEICDRYLCTYVTVQLRMHTAETGARLLECFVTVC